MRSKPDLEDLWMLKRGTEKSEVIAGRLRAGADLGLGRHLSGRSEVCHSESVQHLGAGSQPVSQR